MHRRTAAALLLVLALLLAGCGGGDGDGAVEPTASPTDVTTEEPTSEEADPTETVDEPTEEPTDEMADGEPEEPADEGAQAVTFADELGVEVSGEESYASYRAVSDDNGVITADVPEEWGDVDGAPFEHEGNQVSDFIASTSVEAFNDGWTTPGIRFMVSQAPEAFESSTDLLDLMSEGLEESCEPQGRTSYAGAQLAGDYDLFTDCGGEGVVFLNIGAQTADGTVVGVQAQIVERRDLEALDRALATLSLS